MPTRINIIDRVIPHIPIQIRIATPKQNRVFRGPTPDKGIIIARTKAHQSGFVVVEAAGKAEGLEAGIAIFEDATERGIVDALCDIAIPSIDNQADTPAPVRYKSV